MNLYLYNLYSVALYHIQNNKVGCYRTVDLDLFKTQLRHLISLAGFLMDLIPSSLFSTILQLEVVFPTTAESGTKAHSPILNT